MRCTCVCLCSSLSLSLDGPKGEGDKGGEGSPVGCGGASLPQVLNQPLDPTRTPVLFSPPFEHQPNYLKEEPKTQGSPRDPTEDSTPQPIPTALLTGPAAQVKGAISSPQGSCAPSLTPSGDGWSIDFLLGIRPLYRRPCRYNAPHPGVYASPI